MRPTQTGTTLKPIRLTDQVGRVIQERILNGELQAGDRIVEQKIARELGVGQNPVREALIELSHMGFVQRIPNKATYVTKLTRDDADKMMRVRRVLDELVFATIVEKLETEKLDFSEAENELVEMRKSAMRGDVISFYEHDLYFHRTLWRLADNEHLYHALERLVVPLFAFYIIQRIPSPLSASLAAIFHHEKTLEALKSRSVKEACKHLASRSEVPEGGNHKNGVDHISVSESERSQRTSDGSRSLNKNIQKPFGRIRKKALE